MRRFTAFLTLYFCAAALAQRGGYVGPAEEQIPTVVPDVALANPSEHGFDLASIEALRVDVQRTGGQVLLIMHEGKIVFDWRDGDHVAIETMSATKSLVAMAVGTLIADGRITSIDTPVVDILSEFIGDGREAITIRMLLDHTSGLSGAMSTPAIYQADDIVEFAISSPIERPIGQSFAYNNNATNLLMAVVGKLAGKPADEYIAERIFAPMGITDWAWYRDPAGNPHGMAGCKLRAEDLAKFGQMMIDRGVFAGRQIVPGDWVDMCTRPSQDLYPRVGLLWWLLPQDDWTYEIAQEPIKLLGELGSVDVELLDRLGPAVGRTGQQDDLKTLIVDLLGEDDANVVLDASAKLGLWLIRRRPAPIEGYYADGYLGQFLVVLPRRQLVVVRQQTLREHPEPLDMDRFVGLIERLEVPARAE